MNNKRILPLLLLLATVWCRPAMAEGKWKKVWKGSLVLVGSVSFGDAHSSWGYRELNPLLANSQGRFGAKGAAIKFGVVAGAMTLEAWFLRRAEPEDKPKLYKVFSIANFAYSAGTSVVMVHNYRLPSPGQ